MRYVLLLLPAMGRKGGSFWSVKLGWFGVLPTCAGKALYAVLLYLGWTAGVACLDAKKVCG